MAKGIEPSEEFKKKMKTDSGKIKVKIKAKGKVKPSKFASLFNNLK